MDSLQTKQILIVPRAAPVCFPFSIFPPRGCQGVFVKVPWLVLVVVWLYFAQPRHLFSFMPDPCIGIPLLLSRVGGMRQSLYPPPPARRGQGVPDAFANSDRSYRFADSKSSSGTPPLPPTLSAESLFSHLRLIFPDLFHFWGRSKIHQKSDLYQTLPKPQKSDP